MFRYAIYKVEQTKALDEKRREIYEVKLKLGQAQRDLEETRQQAEHQEAEAVAAEVNMLKQNTSIERETEREGRRK